MGRPFEVRLARDEEVSRVSIAEGTVRVSVHGAEASATFGSLETAACVFEANVRALEAMGFAGPRALPGVRPRSRDLMRPTGPLASC